MERFERILSLTCSHTLADNEGPLLRPTHGSGFFPSSFSLQYLSTMSTIDHYEIDKCDRTALYVEAVVSRLDEYESRLARAYLLKKTADLS
jgi:hypothetical protein